MPIIMPDPLSAISETSTPSLILDCAKMQNNILRMREHLKKRNVKLNPHLKTTKSVEIARTLVNLNEPRCTVSTLHEAAVFSDAGISDILYAVGISPQSLVRAIGMRQSGIELSITLDSYEQADAVATACGNSAVGMPVLIEIDCDGHRGGVPVREPDRLLAIARRLVSGGARIAGVMSHAGESYNCRNNQQLNSAAQNERDAVLVAADILRDAGHGCSVISVGSTPTAYAEVSLPGITEVRAGVFPFFDLTQMGIGVCTASDIAISVLTTVLGQTGDQRGFIIDAGWMALSLDRGTSSQAIDYGYGMVCSALGTPYPNLFVSEVTQEHGIVTSITGSDATLPKLRSGTRLRILPSHACATAAQHEAYNVTGIDPLGGIVVWPRFRGW